MWEFYALHFYITVNWIYLQVLDLLKKMSPCTTIWWKIFNLLLYECVPMKTVFCSTSNKYPSVSLCLFWLLSIRKHIYPPTLSFTSSCMPSVHQQQFKITCCELFIYKDMTHNNQKQFNQIAYKSLYIAKV